MLLPNLTVIFPVGMGIKSKPAGEIIPTDSDRTSLQEFFHCLEAEYATSSRLTHSLTVF